MKNSTAIIFSLIISMTVVPNLGTSFAAIPPKYIEYNEGMAAYEQGDYEKAIIHFENALKLGVDTELMSDYMFNAWYELSILSYNKGDLSQVSFYLNRSLKFNPNNGQRIADVYYKMGKSENEAGDIPYAAHFLAKSLEINPNNALALYEMGKLLYTNGEYEESNKYYEKSLKIDPNNKDAQKNQKIVNEKLKQNSDSKIKEKHEADKKKFEQKKTKEKKKEQNKNEVKSESRKQFEIIKTKKSEKQKLTVTKTK